MNGERSPEAERHRFTDLAVFTTTMYAKDRPSAVRERLAKDFFRRLNNLGIASATVDGGSSDEFIAGLQQSARSVVARAPELGLGASRREALAMALERTDANYLLWTEPEKTDLIDPEKIEAILAPLRDKEADIVIPQRVTKESYHRFQAWIERRGNLKISSMVSTTSSEEIDFWFGPRAFRRDSAKYFSEYGGSGHDSIFTPLLDAIRDGKRLVSVPIAFEYPVEQRRIEEEAEFVRAYKLKRLKQYQDIINSLTHNE